MCSIMSYFVVTACVFRGFYFIAQSSHYQADLSDLTATLFEVRSASCGWKSMFWFFFQTTVRFSFNRLQTLSTPLSHSFSNSILDLTFHSVFLLLHSLCLSFQASNGNDPWSVWNADPSGGSSNNWASNPEGTQTGKSAAGEPWGSVSQGHPQAYQGPGKNRGCVLNNMCKYIKMTAYKDLQPNSANNQIKKAICLICWDIATQLDVVSACCIFMTVSWFHDQQLWVIT